MINQIGLLLSTEIKIPKALQELHGERARISTLILTYLSAFLCAGLAAWQLLQANIPLWRAALGALIFLDIGGGVVANLSNATNQYYQQHSKMRLPFLALHIIHPAVMAALFPSALPYFICVMIFTLAAAFGVNAVRDSELQQNLAALLVSAGCGLAFLFQVPVNVLYLFAPLFMVKLILGFAVRRAILSINDPGIKQ